MLKVDTNYGAVLRTVGVRKSCKFKFKKTLNWNVISGFF